MVTTVKPKLTLEDFLQQPETKPASEFIDGKITQKPMPQGQHSRIQYKLCAVINNIAETEKIACAFPELRCNFESKSIVPDVVVLEWDKIPLTDTGKIANRINTYPDWCIEILSPEQSLTQVLDKLLLCSQFGTQLGWLINPEEEAIFALLPEQKLRLFKNNDPLPVLEKVNLKLTVNEIFNWLKF
ncbi:Uma2 family endonuclease [Cyanobacterium aponinum FACHB-4101]|uniref:Uma2 family endonuclease n=1 Tax=Cyanobacterium aponinum TaxID=379064 RepID=UPI001680268A|nr:Uma2 family endonuclease [Cyanobacterium aponinum]MBD2393192.1 Uma2 family endonuclease [Cyanobacterium aponinum FACHB-4101]